MGTKNTPGVFDCYANALPDEPLFVLLGRDHAAPFAIRAWVRRRLTVARAFHPLWLRTANDQEICAAIKSSFADNDPDRAQLLEALDCADAMDQWRV